MKCIKATNFPFFSIPCVIKLTLTLICEGINWAFFVLGHMVCWLKSFIVYNSWTMNP